MLHDSSTELISEMSSNERSNEIKMMQVWSNIYRGNDNQITFKPLIIIIIHNNMMMKKWHMLEFGWLKSIMWHVLLLDWSYDHIETYEIEEACKLFIWICHKSKKAVLVNSIYTP